MRIIHTSDWHLGKTLEGFSRIDEQEEFLLEFIKIVEEKNADLVLIAGDIFDNGNPSAKAEKMFYNTVKQICNNGKRAVVIIAGNHDSPERLEAINPLIRDMGIIVIGTPKTSVYEGKCGEVYIQESKEGYIELNINNEKIGIITLAYPSEKRLKEVLSEELDEDKVQSNYSQRIGKLLNNLSSNFKQDTINIIMSHLFVMGGKTSDSERSIQLGGSYTVELDKLPLNAQYVALGHLHKSQKFNYNDIPVVYSGSPIQYSKNERSNANCVFYIEAKPNEKVNFSKVLLHNYKPIEVWKCDSIDEAIKRCENDKGNKWIYIEIKTDRVLTQEEIKIMKELRPDIVEISPKMENEYLDIEVEDISKKSMKEMFIEFYKKERNAEPKSEILDLFLSIVQEKEEADYNEA